MGVSKEPRGFLAKLFSSLGSALGIDLTGASGKAANLVGFGDTTAVLAAAAMGAFLRGAETVLSVFPGVVTDALEAIGLLALFFIFSFAIASSLRLVE